MSPRRRELDKSCKICGGFIPRDTASGNIGYCLFFDDEDIHGESLKIPEGVEHETALGCQHYFRRVPGMAPIDFVMWRTAIAQTAIAERKEKIQEKIEQEVRIFGLIIGGITLVQFALDYIAQ